MPQTRRRRSEERVLDDFRSALEKWRGALESHRMAPPDENFAARLAALADAAGEQARACREADAAGFDWTPHRAADSRPPYELQPGTGRRGPEELWRHFDAAAASLSAVATGRDMVAVADAYEELSAAAAALAEAIAREASPDTRRSSRGRGRAAARR
jgi:hypothetical protein